MRTSYHRCAEFFLAMQNAMGVHPSWAELGYDSIVACREHLERLASTVYKPVTWLTILLVITVSRQLVIS